MTTINLDQDFKEILKEELQAQLPEGYPCSVSKELIIKDVIEIVSYSMSKWKEEQYNNNE